MIFFFFFLKRFDGRDMLERLRNKRIILVGDSLNRNQWESLACLLYTSIPTAEADAARRTYKILKIKVKKGSKKKIPP